MGGLFTTLSKQLLGNLVLAAGLPAVAFVAGFQALVAPRLPESWHLLETAEALDPEWKTAFAALGVLIVATALTALNGPIIRLYEGYPLEGSWIGRKLAARHRRRAREAEVWWWGVRSILRGVDRLSPAATRRLKQEGARELGRQWQQVGKTLPRAYPKSGRVLPTRLGNLIRAFEDYPKDEYGIYGVTTWPRLAAVIDEAYAKQIGDAKRPFDLTLNGSIVSFSLAALTLVTGLAWPMAWGRSAVEWVAGLAIVLFLVLLGVVCYRLALPRAAAWGDTVKAAYDLYRWDLLEKLGFAGRPAGMEEERVLWLQIGGHMLCGRMATSEPLEYEEKAASRPSDAGGSETGS